MRLRVGHRSDPPGTWVSVLGFPPCGSVKTAL
jgi:hypothetical protein